MKMIPTESQNYQPHDSVTEQGDHQSNRPLQDMADPALSDKSKFQKPRLEILEQGDVVKTRGGEQALALTTGETIQRDSNGRLRLFANGGIELGVVDKQLPDPDIVPSIARIEYAGGISLIDGPGRQIVQYPDGTEVHVDYRDGFTSVRRNGRTFSIGGREDEFRGFK